MLSQYEYLENYAMLNIIIFAITYLQSQSYCDPNNIINKIIKIKIIKK